MSTATVTLRYAQALVQAAQRLGLPPLDALPADERVPLAQQDRLWQHLCQHSDDPLIGLQLGLGLQVGHLDIAGMLLMSSDTLGQAFADLVEYMPIIGEGGELSLQHDSLQYRAHYQNCRAQRCEAVMAGILHLSRWASGGRFQPHHVCFEHTALDDAQRYPGLLGCEVSFGQDSNLIAFDPAMRRLPLIQANASLRRQLAALADQQRAQLGEQSLSAQLCSLIRQQPQASKDELAAKLAMSGRHLNRKLAEENFSFKTLRDRELQALATEALQNGDKISAVAMALGFSDESAFAKAFRRWSGRSPGEYRSQATANGASTT